MRSIHVICLRDTSQNGERKSTLINLSKRFTEDTKNKQKRIKELADKLGCVKTFLFLHRFLFLLFSASVSQYYMGGYTTLSKSAMSQVTVCCEFDVWKNEFANFLNFFANPSLPCDGCLRSKAKPTRMTWRTEQLVCSTMNRAQHCFFKLYFAFQVKNLTIAGY